MSITRRQALEHFLYGSGALAFRSLLSGIPIDILVNPRRAFSAVKETTSGGRKPQFLIYSTSSAGDPINCNAPGTYDDATIYHAGDPSMQPTSFNLGSQKVRAAQVWSTLSATTLAQTCFFHHATYTSVHPDEAKVLRLMGAVTNQDMLISVIGTQLQPLLSTIQAAPISVSPGGASEAVYYQGTPQHTISPAQLKSILSQVNLGPSTLQAIRDKTVDELNAWARLNSTPPQAAFIDRYVRSAQQARLIPDTILASLTQLNDSSVQSQIQAAIALFQMRITPVAVVHIPFGGDNHSDSNLATEVAEHQSGVASINSMVDSIQAAGMADQVSFASQNVFGRSMSTQAISGRSHNATHHVSLLYGPNVTGSQIGGVSYTAKNGYGALSIDSTSGMGVTGGDIAYADTFGALGKTLCAAVGVPPDSIDGLINSGKIVQAALGGAP